MCADLDRFECAVVFVAHIVFAGRYIAMDTWIFSHNKNLLEGYFAFSIKIMLAAQLYYL